MDYDVAIFIAIVLIFALVAIWMGSIMYQNPYVTPQLTEVRRQCLPGQCAVNNYSGVKRCPTSPTEIIGAVLTTEVCSSQFVCDNTSAPIAIDDRGVALEGSECPTNEQCQCLAGQYCGNDIMVYFQPFTATQDSLTKYQQRNTVTDSLGRIHYTPPFYIPKGQGSCTISPLLYASDALDVKTCLFGTIAYFPRAGATIDGLTTPLACVRGKPCPSGLSAVYDPNTKSVVCRNVPNSVIRR